MSGRRACVAKGMFFLFCAAGHERYERNVILSLKSLHCVVHCLCSGTHLPVQYKMGPT